jgi:hypothetical protein
MTTYANVIKLFADVIEKVPEKLSICPFKAFHPCQMFVGKAWSQPW